MEQLIQETTQLLYEGNRLNRLSSGLALMGMITNHSIPQTFLKELLKWIATDLFSQSNCLPCIVYELKRMIMQLGLNHESIQCCPFGCVLYEGLVNRDLDRCPSCGLAQYVEHSNNVPIKVLRYFPIIPRL